MATLNVEESPVTELMGWLEGTLEWLEDSDNGLDHDDLRQHRNQALDIGTRLLHGRIDDLTTEQVRRLHDLIVHIDRIGY